MYEMWKATIQDLLDEGVDPEAIKDSFREDYPEIPELMALVDELSGKIVPGSKVCSFCKRAQETAYPDMGLQSNFSIPGSTGSPGTGTPISDDSTSAPEGSYKDHVIDRIKMRKQKEEEKKRRERRQLLMDKIAVQPGEALQGKVPKGVPKPGIGIPAESPQKIEQEIRDVGRQVQKEDKPKPATETEPAKKPATPAKPDEKKPEDKSRETETQKKEVKELGKVTKDTAKATDDLDKALTDLLA